MLTDMSYAAATATKEHVMPDTLNISAFRDTVGPVFSDVVQRHRPTKIRRSREEGVLMGADELAALVGQHEFHPRVYREPNAVSIWLPEFELYGRGATLADAKADLVEEVEVYVQEYLEDAELYLRAPNRAHHFPHILKAWLVADSDELEEILFAEPAREEASPCPAEVPLEV